MAFGSLRSAIAARVLIIASFSIPFYSTAAAAADGETGTIRGVVLETRGGAPVDKVLVRLQGSGRGPSSRARCRRPSGTAG